MRPTAEYINWQDVIQLLHRAIKSDKDEALLNILLTHDERMALISRVNIINELLKGDVSQRHLSQMLGVGIATITRGSNEIKQLNKKQKENLIDLFEKK